MFNFNIDINKIFRDNLPAFLHLSRRLNMMKALAKPFRVIWADFLLRKDEIVYRAKMNGETVKLEAVLNDRFDNTLRRIYISDATYAKLYLYRKSELKPDMVLYMKWNSTINYTVGKFCWYQGNVYECNTNCINKVPGVDPQWTLTTRKAPILRKKANFSGEVTFIVNVPSAITFIEPEMKRLINMFKLAGLGYHINII